MAVIKERWQNPVIGDQLRLKMLVYNSNNRADVFSVDKVEIYVLDKNEVTESNPYGRRLVKTIESDNIVRDDCGVYSTTFEVEQDCFTIGKYCDVWTFTVREGADPQTTEQIFQIYPDLWYTTPIPMAYDFNFAFRPNKVRHGSKRYIQVEIEPNVPGASDLRKFYENLAIVSPLRISIEQACGACLPAEEDLRLIVDCEPVDFREKCKGFYFLDTTDMDCGIYNVWFTMEFGESTYISDKQQLQIF